MLNVAVLMGRLVADPEIRHTSNDIAVTSFTIAVDKKFQRQGEDKQADFIDIVAWRATADFVCKYFRKGQLISIDGSIQTRSYQDKDGNKRKAFEIVADNVSFCGSKSDNQASSTTTVPLARAAAASYTPTVNPSPEDFQEVLTDDDLPF